MRSSQKYSAHEQRAIESSESKRVVVDLVVVVVVAVVVVVVAVAVGAHNSHREYGQSRLGLLAQQLTELRAQGAVAPAGHACLVLTKNVTFPNPDYCSSKCAYGKFSGFHAFV